MKKLTIFSCLALAIFLLTPALASAHDMWATADNPAVGSTLTANIGYGHHFPAMEDIPAEELPFFQIWAVGPDGQIDLTPGSPNYVYTSTGQLAKQTYLVISDVKPIYWTRTTAGKWEMKPKNEVAGAASCENAIENAKGIIVVGGDTNGNLATTAQGLPLEIVPLVHPATVKAGQALPLQILFEGKPLAGAEVKARYSGLPAIASDTALAFTDTTDQEGKVNFVPLVQGEWMVMVRNDTPYTGPNSCDKNSYGTNLHFTIN
jgi:uncharacterized GH25 family protein